MECDAQFPFSCDGRCVPGVDSGDCPAVKKCACFLPTPMARMRKFREWRDKREKSEAERKEKDRAIREKQLQRERNVRQTQRRNDSICPFCGGKKFHTARACNSCHNKMRHGIEPERIMEFHEI